MGNGIGCECGVDAQNKLYVGFRSRLAEKKKEESLIKPVNQGKVRSLNMFVRFDGIAILSDNKHGFVFKGSCRFPVKFNKRREETLIKVKKGELRLIGGFVSAKEASDCLISAFYCFKNRWNRVFEWIQLVKTVDQSENGFGLEVCKELHSTGIGRVLLETLKGTLSKEIVESALEQILPLYYKPVKKDCKRSLEFNAEVKMEVQSKLPKILKKEKEIKLLAKKVLPERDIVLDLKQFKALKAKNKFEESMIKSLKGLIFELRQLKKRETAKFTSKMQDNHGYLLLLKLNLLENQGLKQVLVNQLLNKLLL